MAYRWTEQGPALEFATPYATENRFLRWRGYALLVLAVVLVLVPALLEPTAMAGLEVITAEIPEMPPSWPHYVIALGLLVLGVLDLVQAGRQRALRLTRGEPASLVKDMYHEATGTSPGASQLLAAMLRGQPPVTASPGRYKRLIDRLAPHAVHAPLPLQTYLRVRMAHLVLAAGLLVLLAAGTLVLKPGVALALLALVIGAIGSVFVARRVLFSGVEAPHPLWVLAAWLAVASALVGLALAGKRLPELATLRQLSLPLATAVVLAVGMLCDGLGLLAAKAQAAAPTPQPVPAQEDELAMAADPRQLMQEIDRELFRRWAEGVPSRRYIWVPPLLDKHVAQGEFQARLLEETQPLHEPSAAMPGSGWLRAIGWLSLVAGVGGSLLCLVTALAHVRGLAQGWWPSTVGLAAVLAGLHALRVAHLLWTRMELVSTITHLEVKGRWTRSGPTALLDAVKVHAHVAQARSVFYAASPLGLGTRTLLGWRADDEAGRGWIQFVRDWGDKAAGPDPAAAARARARAAGRSGPESDVALPPAAAPGARVARFCAQCGTPVLAGARFCQNCGAALG
jgi:hypothetical protein